MPNQKKYTIISLCTITAITAAAAIAFYAMGKAALIVPLIVLGVFFCAANSCSLYIRGMFGVSSSSSITSFYLIDKAARFLASIILICVLIYLYKANGLIIGVTAFIYYIIAMALELSYFFAIERKKGIQNA